jgi:hypothetical protein
VRGECDIGQDIVAGLLGKARLEHADGFAAIGHRREDAGTTSAGLDHEALASERAPVRASRQRHALGGLASLDPPGRVAARMAESHERPSAEVGKEKRDRCGAERACEALGDDVGCGDRRRVLDRRE